MATITTPSTSSMTIFSRIKAEPIIKHSPQDPADKGKEII
jgi:hypothetical protein